MISIYVQELERKEEISNLEKFPKLIQKLIWKLLNKMNLVIVKKIDENKRIYLIPNIEKERIYKKLKSKIEKEKTQTQKVEIILSKKIKQYKKYLKEYKILEGKMIFLQEIEAILKKVLGKNLLALQDVYILTNQYNQQNMSAIYKLAPKVKTMNIVTKEVERYKGLEETLQEEGIAISVANNKRKSLKKAKIIINIDFTKEELKQYSVFRNAILLNVAQEKLTNLNGFDGVVIQDIEVELKDKQKEFILENYLKDSFRQIELYESLQEKSQNKDDIKINNLYGNNGKISEKELLNKQNILTN